MRKFGLVGRNISYSFSRKFFSEKFSTEGIDATYENFDLQDISEFPEVIKTNPELAGLNVTIPYKQAIFPFLDELDPIAEEIGAVNTIKVGADAKLTGFNTDYFGFSQALLPHLKSRHKKALVLGTGGASKAVVYALKTLGISSQFVSRSASENAISYTDLDTDVMEEHLLLINCTPLGTFPNNSEYPDIPIQNIGKNHLVFDLIYNPPVTKLLELAKTNGATILNGREMLEFQAEKAWEIWNSR